MLELKDVTKSFGDGKSERFVLNKVSLTVPDGDFIAVIGSSGAGKSTLLNTISGLEPLTGGDIILGGEKYSAMNDDKLTRLRRKKISVIYQFFNLVSVLNAADNIRLPLLLDKRSCDENELNDVLSALNIGHLRDKFPSQLSGGEQQRVAIARALISRPELLLADEPTGNLDKMNSHEVARQLREANERCGLTTIMVTHDMEIAAYAKRIIRLEDGHIVEDEVSRS